MKLVLALPGNEALAAGLSQAFGCEHALLEVHRFPDGEQRVRIPVDVRGRSLLLAAGLHEPDHKVLPLLFTVDAARELGAESVGLVTPYLPYMRQDARFRAGEAISAHTFCHLLGQRLDWLVTVDPHLHRVPALGEVFAPPSRVVGAAPALAAWIGRTVRHPFIVGPDAESAQWARRIAAELGVPWRVLEKSRLGDRDVVIAAPGDDAIGREAVLVDDIVSSGATLLAAAQVLRAAHWHVAHAACVHALCGAATLSRFAAAGVQLASCNTVPHATNAIDVVPLLAEALREFALP